RRLAVDRKAGRLVADLDDRVARGAAREGRIRNRDLLEAGRRLSARRREELARDGGLSVPVVVAVTRGKRLTGGVVEERPDTDTALLRRTHGQRTAQEEEGRLADARAAADGDVAGERA